MSAQQLKNFVTFRRVLSQLKSFGLNPNEWQIERRTLGDGQIVKLQHRSDADFTMNAKLKATQKGDYKMY